MRPSVHCRGPFLWAWDTCGNLSLSPTKPSVQLEAQLSAFFTCHTLSPLLCLAEWVHPSGNVLARWELGWGLPHDVPLTPLLLVLQISGSSAGKEVLTSIFSATAETLSTSTTTHVTKVKAAPGLPEGHWN